MSRVYEEPQISKRQFKRKQKWPRDLNRHFTKEDQQMTNKSMKRFSTSQVIKKTKLQL